ncbi:MAG: XTP/dITP diphosphatase [Lentisphaeria bacterium]|nr:XTP/dITP diphosphatase [Lentisphaeria bacterium]
MLQLLAATTNKNKVREFQEILQDLKDKINIVTQDTIPNFPEIVEDGSSFEENAMKKAKESSAFADMVAMADDSGLVVEALDGAPGIHSARYAGENATDADRIAKLLKAMEGKKDRRAKFVCAAAIAYRGEEVRTFVGEVKGVIADAPSGTNGFGYDPVFIPDGFNKTFAELTDEEKNAISHRGNAMRAVADFLRDEFAKMDDFEFV